MKMLNPPEGNAVVIPAFIAKLWHMVSDPETNSLISWGYDSTTFLIKDHNKFSSEMLPRYYKHNNMASFIRQLNMYSFHKVVSIDSPSLKNNKELEFSHPYFLRDQPHLLKKIQRKIHSKEGADVIKSDQSRYNKLLLEVKQLRAIQELFGNKLSAMKQENAALWREHSILRQRHAKQEKIVNKVIQFLVSMVQQTTTYPRKVGIPLMIRDKPSLPQKRKYMLETTNGPIICELDPSQIRIEPDLQKGDAKSIKVIRSSNKPEVISISPDLVKLPTSSNNARLNCASAIPVQVINTNQGYPLVTTTQGQPIQITVKTEDISDQECAYINLPSQNDQAVSSVTQSQATFKPRSKRRGNRKSSVPIKKKKTDRESSGNVKFELPEIFDELVIPEPLNEPCSSTNLQPLITSPSSTFEARSPVEIPISNVPESPVELSSLTDNINLDLNLTNNEKQLGDIAKLIATNTDTEETSAPQNEEKNLSLIPTSLPDVLNREDADTHLDKIQSEIDILKDILKHDGLTLDANTILELFNDDPLSLNLPPAASEPSSSNFDNNEIISYSSGFDIDDLTPDINEQDPLDESEYLINSTLNTPQVRANNDSPVFPS